MKKVIFTIAIGVFALATVFNMNMAKRSLAGDVTLESIAVMAQAQAESGGSPYCYLIHVGWQNGVPLVRCGQTAYQDPSGTTCDCWSGTRLLY